MGTKLGVDWLRPARWTELALRHRSATVTVLASVTLVALVGVLQLETQVGYRAFLGGEHPVIVDFDRIVERFGGGLPLVAVWSCRASTACAGALDLPSLAMAADVADRLASVAAVRGVDSPATSGLLARPVIGFPEMRRLWRNGAPVADIEDLRAQALEDSTWLRRLVSEDGTAGAIIVHLKDSSSASAESAYAALRSATAAHERAGFEYYFVGGPVEFVVAASDLDTNTRRVMPVMVGLIGLVLVFLFGAPTAAAVALLTVGIAVAWTLGAMGWLGWPQNSLTQILPPLILVVGVCDAVHLLAAYAPSSDGYRQPMMAAAERVGDACAMTTLTTAVGFASLATSGLESISRFGVLAAFAVSVALLLTFVALPVFVSFCPHSWFGSGAARHRWARLLAAIATATTGRASPAFVAVAMVALFLGAWGTLQLRVDASFEDLYGEDSDVVRWAVAAQVLRQPETLEVVVAAPPGTAALPVESFAILEDVQRDIGQLPGIGSSVSILDSMRRLNRLLHRDELPLGEVGDERGRPASIYRLLRSRNPEVTRELVDADRPALRVSFNAAKLPQDELRIVLSRVREILDRHLPESWTGTVSGPLAVVSQMIDAIRETQLRSFSLTAVAVFLILLAFFRSIRIAAIAMVPTVLPAVVTLGTMGWLGVPLDIGSTMVAAVILGLAVDDAIHVMSAYVGALEAGATRVAASCAAIRTTGVAVVTTSTALAVGFVTLTFSAWQSIASFGFIAAIAVIVALVAALAVLPALAAR